MAMLPSPLEREWLWAALQTLVEARGEAALLTAPILLPTDEHFPDRWTADEHGVEEKLTDVTTIYLGFGVLTTAAAARFVTKHHDNLGSSYAHKQQGYLAWNEMAFMLASQLQLRGYDERTVKWFAKHLPSNQAATIRAAIHEATRPLIANAMGFDQVPAVSPSPMPASRSLWQRLLGRR